MRALELYNPLASNSPAHPTDVLNAKNALGTLGYYKPPAWGVTEIPDQDMINGVKKFQKDNALTVDGVMKPKGFTEQKVNKKLSEVPKPKIPDLSAVGKSLKLAASVGVKSTNQSRDFEKVRQKLTQTGHLDKADAHKPAAQIYRPNPKKFTNAIRNFQSDNGLKADGYLNPGGPTEKILVEKTAITANAAGTPSGPDDGTEDCNIARIAFRRKWRQADAKYKEATDLQKGSAPVERDPNELRQKAAKIVAQEASKEAAKDVANEMMKMSCSEAKRKARNYLKQSDKIETVTDTIDDYEGQRNIEIDYEQLTEDTFAEASKLQREKDEMRGWDVFATPSCNVPTSSEEPN